MNWGRILVFALILFALAKAVAFLLGALYPYTWHLYGATFEQAAPLILPVRRVVTAMLALAVYLVFLRPISERPLAHALVLCVVTTAFTVAWDAWGARSAHEAFDPRNLVGHVIVALAAWLASALFRRFSPEQVTKPGRGS